MVSIPITLTDCILGISSHIRSFFFCCAFCSTSYFFLNRNATLLMFQRTQLPKSRWVADALLLLDAQVSSWGFSCELKFLLWSSRVNSLALVFCNLCPLITQSRCACPLVTQSRCLVFLTPVTQSEVLAYFFSLHSSHTVRSRCLSLTLVTQSRVGGFLSVVLLKDKSVNR